MAVVRYNNRLGGKLFMHTKNFKIIFNDFSFPNTLAAANNFVLQSGSTSVLSQD